MSLTVPCKHGKVGFCTACQRESFEKYSTYGPRCRVCGEITGLQESDVCFDHRNKPRPAPPADPVERIRETPCPTHDAPKGYGCAWAKGPLVDANLSYCEARIRAALTPPGGRL